MAIFKKAHRTMVDCLDSIKAANEVFANAQSEIVKTFKDPTAKVAEARAILNQTEAEQRQLGEEVILNEVAAAKQKIQDIITASVPADFEATLAAIMAKGDSISDYECKAYLNKYAGNYPAVSALLNVFYPVKKSTDLHIIHPEDFEGRINNVVQNAFKALRSPVDGYMVSLYSSEEASPFIKLGEDIDSFIGGNFFLNASQR